MSQCNVCWQDETEIDSEKHDHPIALVIVDNEQTALLAEQWLGTYALCNCHWWVADRDRSLPIVGDKKPTRNRQETNKISVFVTFQTFSKLRNCATKLIRPSYCAFCLECQGQQGLHGREGQDTRCKMRRTHCVAVGHKPTHSSCLHRIPQPLFVFSCLHR